MSDYTLKHRARIRHKVSLGCSTWSVRGGVPTESPNPDRGVVCVTCRSLPVRGGAASFSCEKCALESETQTQTGLHPKRNFRLMHPHLWAGAELLWESASQTDQQLQAPALILLPSDIIQQEKEAVKRWVWLSALSSRGSLDSETSAVRRPENSSVKADSACFKTTRWNNTSD